MKAREVSVGIQDMNGEYSVLVRFKVQGPPLEREACGPSGTRVKASSRGRKEKELRKILESMEF